MVNPPESDAEIPQWLAGLGLSGLIDLHVHFLPERMLAKVWTYFDRIGEHARTAWPVYYRHDETERLRRLRSFGVTAFAPLVYPHKPGMAQWLNSWVADFVARTPDAVLTATVYPEPEVTEYTAVALDSGVRCIKAHVQVGGYDPRDPLLDRAWGLIAEAGIPTVVHCGHWPPGKYTGLDVFDEVLRRHPRLTAVLAHAGMPDYTDALSLAERYPRVHLDTTMVGTAFTERFAPLPAEWATRLVDLGDRLVLGTDFPNIPYPYCEQLAAIADWAAADDRLGDDFLRRVLCDTPARLLDLPRHRRPAEPAQGEGTAQPEQRRGSVVQYDSHDAG